ncbi:hypothetical protein VTN02DRAFT_4740 [Thermoascus thermophilus]
MAEQCAPGARAVGAGFKPESTRLAWASCAERMRRTEYPSGEHQQRFVAQSATPTGIFCLETGFPTLPS